MNAQNSNHEHLWSEFEKYLNIISLDTQKIEYNAI